MFPLWTFTYGEGYIATWLSSLAAQLCQDMSALAEIQQCTPYQKQSKHYFPTSSSLQSAVFRGHALFDLSLLHLHSGGLTGSPYFVPDFQSSCKPYFQLTLSAHLIQELHHLRTKNKMVFIFIEPDKFTRKMGNPQVQSYNHKHQASDCERNTWYPWDLCDMTNV